MEVHCKRCQFHDAAYTLRPGSQACPNCSALLNKRLGQPGPLSHLGPLMRAVFSVGGIMIMAFYSVVDGMPTGRVRWLVAVLLYLTAIKMAYSAMNTSKNVVKFPELDPREFFATDVLFPVLVYVLLFISLPAGLIQLGLGTGLLGQWKAPAPVESSGGENADADQDDLGEEDDFIPDDVSPEEAAQWHAKAQEHRKASATQRTAQLKAWKEKRAEEHAAAQAEFRQEVRRFRVVRVVAFGLAVLLLLYSAMALVLFLNGNTLASMFDLGLAARLMKRDIQGYLTLAGIITVLNAVRFVAESNLVRHNILVAIPADFLKAAATLLGYGLCGLYVRQHARALELPVDEEDWEALPFEQAPPAARTPTRPNVPAQPTPAETAPPVTQTATTPAVEVQVFRCRFAGRDANGVRVQTGDGRSMVLQAAQVRALAAVVVPIDGKEVLMTDVVLRSPGFTVLRFTSEDMALETVFPDMAPRDAFAAMVTALLQAGATAWPNAQALTSGQYPQAPSLGAFEQVFHATAGPVLV